jgi:acyl-coenzyme A thioesterase PaaI-like protein
MKTSGEDRPPCTVTADYAIKLLRPTPTDVPLFLSAKIVESEGNKATVEGTLSGGGKVCATCRGTFVSVKEGHPAFHRW